MVIVYATLNVFLEKLYSFYRDGLNERRDMRSFASLHLFVRVFGMVLGYWNISGLLFFGICCLLI